MQGLCVDGPLANEYIPGLPDTVDGLPQFLELPESVDDEDDELVEIPPGGEFPEMKRAPTHMYRYVSITATTIANDPRTTQVIAHYTYVRPSEVA
jgi:hypothetical protein